MPPTPTGNERCGTLGCFGKAAHGCIADDTFGMGAALAFYTVFSLGPLLVIATAVAAHLIGADQTRAQFVRWAELYLSADGATALFDMMQGARSLSMGITAGAVGAVTLFFGVTGVFGQLKRSLNTIMGASPSGKTVVKKIVHDRLAALATACALGFVLLAGLVLSAAVTAAGSYLGRWIPMPAWLFFGLNVALSIVILAPLMAVIFQYLPDARMPWRSAWTGALVTAVLFQVGALAVGAYLGAKVLATVYGPAGSMLAILLWAYYSAQTVLFGAEFTRAHAAMRRTPDH